MALRAAPSVVQSAARTRKRSAPSPPTWTQRGSWATTSSGTGAGHDGECAERRQTEQLPPRPFAVEDRRRITVRGGDDHLVVGREGLDEYLGRDPTGSHDQRQGLLRRPEARCEQLGVELEERHHVGRPDAMEHGLGPDVDAGAGGRIGIGIR